MVRGAHKLGRIDHVLTGEQAGADKERMAEILKRFELVYVEMEAGDALFFHHCLFVRAMCSGLSAPRFASMMAKRQSFVWEGGPENCKRMVATASSCAPSRKKLQGSPKTIGPNAPNSASLIQLLSTKIRL